MAIAIYGKFLAGHGQSSGRRPSLWRSQLITAPSTVLQGSLPLMLYNRMSELARASAARGFGENAMQIGSGDCLEGQEERGSKAAGSAIAVCPAELLLLREMTHRINNELTSMIGFVSRVAIHSTDCGTRLALAEVMEHLHDQARLHRALQMPTENRLTDATAYLRVLCQAISRVKLESRGIELVLVEHRVRLSSLQCWQLGMIVCELITNSCRHAFGDRGGTIRIELKKRGSYAECRLTDDGHSSNIGQSGRGLAIVRGLARALDGDVDLSFGEDGAVALVSFPALKQVKAGWAAASDP